MPRPASKFIPGDADEAVASASSPSHEWIASPVRSGNGHPLP